MMICPMCKNEMDVVDSTFSNVPDSKLEGMQTGDIYYCAECEQHYLMDFVNNVLREWMY